MSEKKCACNGKPYRSDGSYCPGCGRPVSEHATHGADRYEKIRKALTMEPTAGPWRCEHETGGGHDCWMIYSGDWPKSGGIVGYYKHTGPRHIPHVRPNTEAVAIAHHIAACDPDTIRMLLEERDALAAELEAIRATHPTERSESDD